eukprot:TRINITY_DN19183_c0_g1_i1.p1 TRINITY_DN19183_c0_g1~~TRINITY_DN19183_c0_g1_i1.p1  ORF type:complete len:108 (+),score=38.59 TRINITY_DN19183_c0_g1_i1:199-522(+)
MLEMFLTKKEHIKAVSFINKKLFGDAAVVLENILHIKGKLLAKCSISVFDCLLELTACLVEFGTYETAFKFCSESCPGYENLAGVSGGGECEDSCLENCSVLGRQDW